MDPRPENRQRKNARKAQRCRTPKRNTKRFRADVGVAPRRSVPNRVKQGTIRVYRRKRNSVKHNKMLHAFATAKDEAEKKPALEKLSLFLLAECSKGFNNSDPKWLNACLEAAKTPTEIQNVVDAFSLNEPIYLSMGYNSIQCSSYQDFSREVQLPEFCLRYL